jgi:hypothetical protein
MGNHLDRQDGAKVTVIKQKAEGSIRIPKPKGTTTGQKGKD